MKTVNFTGTVHQASLRAQDLLPAFMGVLEEHHPGAHAEIEDAIWGTAFMDSLINEDVWDAMQEIAPEGYYFGAHIGDGSDFGFWPIEDE